MVKYIFVTGGVTSSLGKGIIAASLGKLLTERGLKVTIQKFDPYLNVDPGTLNPYEHGECYVTEDGAETDLDLGHYERFLNIATSQANNVTTGKIYQEVIQKERKGEYLGKTVQIIPHITDEIKRRIRMLEYGNYDIIITEIGGTVGDIESLPYLEAIRQFRMDYGTEKCVFIHLTLVPYLSASKELKSKPTQHSVKELQMAGIMPQIIVCRTEHPLPSDLKRKISLFCNVENDAVIEAIDVSTIYQVPILMQQENLDEIVLRKLGLPIGEPPKLIEWKHFLANLSNPKYFVTIGLIGKYNELPDAYKSIYESFIHAGASLNTKVNVIPIHSESLESEENPEKLLSGLNGALVGPGFGERGIDGKLRSLRWIRENNIPFLGICLGMQCAIIEYFRNVLKIPEAQSTEIDKASSFPVIDLMEEQKGIKKLGGTMRLGNYRCKITPGSQLSQIYDNQQFITERHRHRYEFNNNYKELLENSDLTIGGVNPDNHLVEAIEHNTHPFYVGVQYHPEYRSTVLNPHPLFQAFISAAIQSKENTIFDEKA